MLRDGVRLFGTDGVRGVANSELTPELALRLGRAAGTLLPEGATVLVGRDTRRSGEMLSMAIQAGFNSAGVDTVDAGILTTGGISLLTSDSSVDMGVVVSASHNPAEDNGIKLLASDGTKLSDETEDRIEASLREGNGTRTPIGGKVGTRFPMDDSNTRYIDRIVSGAEFSFRGISVTLDCANGAAALSAPELFRKLHAEVEVLADSPDGVNINSGCGATHPEFLASRNKGTIGLTFDGDADRLIAIDEKSRIVDGDIIMAIIAKHLASRGALPGNKIVVTVMSNLGIHKAMREAGIEVVTTKVGDRYVREAMVEHGAMIGGEQSGHVIFLDRGITGDGPLTGVRLLEVVAATGLSLADLSDRAMKVFPQVLKNVRVARREALEGAKAVWDAVGSAEKELGDSGRVLLRPSGTEPVVRVMVEASTEADAERYASSLAEIVVGALGESS